MHLQKKRGFDMKGVWISRLASSAHGKVHLGWDDVSLEFSILRLFFFYYFLLLSISFIAM